jgi:hypothetical protein
MKTKTYSSHTNWIELHISTNEFLSFKYFKIIPLFNVKSN